MKKLLAVLLIAVIAFLSILVATDRAYLITAARTIWLRGQTDAGIHDFTVQPLRAIEAGEPQPWPKHKNYNRVPLSEEILEHHQTYQSTAFLIAKDGELISEHYFNGSHAEDVSSIWSISKSFITFAILKAIQDGLIDNINDPVKKYIPEWPVEQSPTLTLHHLGSMSAGLYWEEMDHSPFSLIAKFTFHDDISRLSVHELPATGVPGDIQHYNSGGTQLLGTTLARVLNGKTISDYISESFWKPLGMQQDGYYVLDKKGGNERVFGGIVAAAKDVAKFGQLFLNEGQWNGNRILAKQHIDMIKQMPYNNKTYGYGIWVGEYNGDPVYNMQGFLGQFNIIYPKENLLITRLGHQMLMKEDLESSHPQVDILLQEALRIVAENEKMD
ncbi:MAG: beta-lactamase family protein [Gammaproteobacteria bacterium]|nr:beta-lactamase family protein [Gammaproteobacteria bacterium]NNM12851.1 serine hydrolase [Gammaproteobacteria bacterium]